MLTKCLVIPIFELPALESPWGSPMFLRHLSALTTAVAIASSSLAIAATPAAADIAAGANINPSTWSAGQTTQAVVSWTESNATADTATSRKSYANGGQYISVEVGWGWVMQSKNPTNTAVSYTATWDPSAKAFRCELGAGVPRIIFASTGFSANGDITCLIRRSSNPPSASDPGQQVVLSNDDTNGKYFGLAAASAITVTFESEQVTAPAAGPAADAWRIISLASGGTNPTTAQTTTVRTVVPGPDGELPKPIVDTLDFDGNGGTCSPTSKSGERGTWSTALTADNCSRPGFNLTGFATSPTLAPGSVYVPPGGPIYFGGSNRFYALWSRPITPPAAPTDVVAVAGRNKVTLSWKAPSDDGGSRIRAYLAKATPSGANCITRLNVDVNMLSCELFLPATNTKYTFQVQANNELRGWGEASAASNAVSPYDFREVSGSRENVLFGLAGTKVQARGVAPGLAGLAVTPEFKVGAAAEWSREANAAKVNADGNFSWSKSFPASANKQNVSVRFTYGGDAVSDTLVMARGAKVGSLSAPRNVEVENKVNEPIVTWDAPKFDGGSKITEYQVCLQSPGSATGCVRAGESPRKVWDLRPGLYTVTVAAKNAKGFGPAAKASKPFRVTRASIGIDSRTDKDFIANVRYNGFAQGTKFTVEVGSWERGTSYADAAFVKSGTVTVSTVGEGNEQLRIPLQSGNDRFNIRLRLVTPNGETYSRVSRSAAQ